MWHKSARHPFGYALPVVLCLSFFLGIAQEKSPAPTARLVKVGRLLDVKTGEYLSNQGVLVLGERIKEVGPLTTIESHAPEDTIAIDLSNVTALPVSVDKTESELNCGLIRSEAGLFPEVEWSRCGNSESNHA